MSAGLSLSQLTVALIAVLAGALVQGSIGFGFSLVSVPVLSLIRPDALPAMILFVATPMTFFMMLRERGSIDWRGFWLITGGRTVGLPAALLLLAVVPERNLSALIGLVIVVAVLMSVVASEFELGTSGSVLAGVASGVMGTVAAVGGPPLAVAYQNRPGPELRSTLAASFVVGCVMSLTGLAIVGRVSAWQALLALQVLPAMLIGLLLSKHVIRHLDRGWLRSAILVFAGISGVVTIVDGLVA